MNTKLTVFTNGNEKSYTISRFDRKLSAYTSCPIPNQLGLLILEMYACTLYKEGNGYTIYNL